MSHAAGDVDLSGGWAEFWSTITGSAGNLDFLPLIGAAVAVVAIIVFFWKRHGKSSTGKDFVALLWMLALAAALCAPNAIIPFILGIFDGVMNAVIGLVRQNT